MKISYKSNINDAINEILRHFLLILPLKMKVELFIANDEENIKLSDFNHKENEQWRKDLEVQALSEYYNRKVKIIN